MTAQAAPPTKAQLLDALSTSGRLAVERLRALPPERFAEGRYENGWNAREILAHIASIEWTYPRLIDIAAGAPPPAPRGEPSGVPTRTAQGGILSYNDRQVAKRADATVEELLDEFERNRAATIAAVEAADESLFAATIRSAGGIEGPLAGVINAVAVLHVLAHASDILGEPLAGGGDAP